jgi:hypothetical protein
MKAQERTRLLEGLENRFENNRQRHESLRWTDVRTALEQRADALASLMAMEETGGEPDVIGLDSKTGRFMFCDCAAESPSGRRSLCYDDAALASRKEARPRSSVMRMAAEMGIELLTQARYAALQQLGEFDTRTASWILTPPEVRALGGALFCDRRYGQVFTYHNGASSYYAVRGFRGLLCV